MKTVFMFLSCVFLLAGSPKNTDNTVEYIPYTEIPINYSLEDSKEDGLVVYENSDITWGQDVWDSFVADSQKGNPCMVRLAFYYTLGDPSQYSPELYEEIKNDYPQLYIWDLSFDGNVYTLYFAEGERVHNFTYKYLKRFEEKPENSTAIFSESIRYVLVNDEEVTWEQIVYGWYSSQSDDWIDHKLVYSDYVFKE